MLPYHRARRAGGFVSHLYFVISHEGSQTSLLSLLKTNSALTVALFEITHSLLFHFFSFALTLAAISDVGSVLRMFSPGSARRLAASPPPEVSQTKAAHTRATLRSSGQMRLAKSPPSEAKDS